MTMKAFFSISFSKINNVKLYNTLFNVELDILCLAK